MPYFTQMPDLPSYDLYDELNDLLQSGMISWKGGQIGINTLPECPDDIHAACGSLWYDWDNTYVETVNGITTVKAPERSIKRKESDFNTLARPFVGSVFEELYRTVDAYVEIGRMRIMKMEPKTCLTWHIDDTKRLHYPVKTQEGCFMVINDQVRHLPANEWVLTDTLHPHTAFNGSNESRIHVVVEIL